MGRPAAEICPPMVRKSNPDEMTALVDFSDELAAKGTAADPIAGRHPDRETAMSPVLDAFFLALLAVRPPAFFLFLGLAAGIYFARLAGAAPAKIRSAGRGGQLVAFLGGLAVLVLALASPIEPFRLAVPPSPHAAAPVADDGSTSLALAWCTGLPAAAGPPAASPHVLGRAAVSIAGAAGVLSRG